MLRQTNTLLRFLRNEAGASAVEFSLVVTIFVIACMGVLEFGRAFQVRNEMAYAADRGARAIMLDLDETLTAAEITTIKNDIKASFKGYTPSDLTVTIGDITVGTQAYKTLDLSYPMSIFIPTFTETLTMTVTRRVPII